MTRARDVANIDGVLTTTGDMYVASAAATPARLGIGSTGQVLTVAGGTASWATAGAASTNYSLLATNTSTGVNSITFSGLSGKSKYMISYNLSLGDNGISPLIRFNGDTGSNYTSTTQVQRGVSAVYNATITNNMIHTYIGNLVQAPYSSSSGMILIDGTNSSSFYTVTWLAIEGGTKANVYGFYTASAACSSITLASDAGYNWTGNTTKLFGSVA